MKLRALTKVEDASGLKGTSKLWRISILISFVSLTLYIVGVATSKWVAFDNEEFKSDLDDPSYRKEEDVNVGRHYGLWRKCITYSVKDTVVYDDCKAMDNGDDWKPAAKVLCSLGLALGVIGLVAAVWAGWVQNNGVAGAAGTFVILAGICGAVGSATFVGKAKDSDDRFEPRYSVFLALIGCALLICGGGLQLLSIESSYSTIA